MFDIIEMQTMIFDRDGRTPSIKAGR